uniref:Uncharacterized protein n=1 Tax=Ficus carica TaxID=3494 RepID=A0AA88EB73_FICCA|nr:hypothetical protein TIFTF001_055507 [Ficus carica]GMN71093.1 hypothetical protein TIFTF001_055509 [Ficus carica]
MENKGFLSEDFVVKLIFGGILFATFESISAVIAPAFELLSEHPRMYNFHWLDGYAGPLQSAELDSHVVSKNFMPFSGGTRQRAGAEYSRVFMATFFHVLLTRYRRMKIKAGKIY